ncbi:MAG: tRNA lysidine(34) synthetase TilS [Deltaproteobacteria bacterium]|nr:tRNA lysidine(34) synthetase TilS [Deltaproteobacteria bacterium]
MNIVTDIIRKVDKTISKYCMIRRGDRIIVAVSGGVDSVCLLDVFHSLKEVLGIELVVAHFDHGLRPDEDEYETEFVKSLAASFECDFVTKRANPDLQPETASLEERARDVRYRFLNEVKEQFSAQKIAMGHNLNDQAETVLIRLLRGSGPSGLSGIPPVRDTHIIRPLIEVTRSEIESYLSNRGLRHITDSSNSETKYLRNEIRLNLLPQLEKYQPKIVEILGRTATIMREETTWLEAKATRWLKKWAEKGSNDEIVLPLFRFKGLPEPLKNHVIRQALKRKGGSLRRISLPNIDAIKQIATGSKPQAEVSLPNMLAVKRVYDKLIFLNSKPETPKRFCYIIDKPGTFDLETLDCTMQLEAVDRKALPKLTTSAWAACLDADLITYPLMLRNFRPGDRFVPLGMTGHKKLKSFFIDMKIPSHVRACIPILTQGNEPIWICGLRIDDRFKVTSRTQRVLKITFDDQGSTLYDKGLQ